MSVYLRDIPLTQALDVLRTSLEKLDRWKILETEDIPLDENALKRVLAEDIWAKICTPHYHASAMDGFAVRAEETIGAEQTKPLTLYHHSSDEKKGYEYVDTGDPLPDGFDSVIPIENIEPLDELGNIDLEVRHPKSIRIRTSVIPWSNIRSMGEDIIQSQLVLPAGHVLRPVDLGAIAASGYEKVRVSRKPRIAIIPTGSELVSLGSELKPGDILEFNSIVLAAKVVDWGGIPTRLPITPDDLELLCERVLDAARTHDLILLNAGSSAGEEDYSARVVEKLGKLLVHGIAVRPGHPVIIGYINKASQGDGNIDVNEVIGGNNSVPIIGVPGFPVSAAMTADIFVEPLIARWTGRLEQELPIQNAFLTRKITSPAGDDDYVRVIMGMVGNKVLSAPLARGAGTITSLVRADGLVVLPRGVQGAEAGEEVQVKLLTSMQAIERTIFCIGSHDMTLDLLAEFLSHRKRRLISSNVGSQGGLIALKRGESHIAGSHLLDPETGVYNITYVKKYLAGVKVGIYSFVKREQGLIIRSGNPKKINSLLALKDNNIRFINRQRGAGTRVLLDYHLSKLGITPAKIHGYKNEEYTHLGVAVAVASGRADCGLGIPAAARALNLDFVPLFEEDYQLIVPTVFINDELLTPLFEIITSLWFHKEIMKLPGYSIKNMGKLLVQI